MKTVAQLEFSFKYLEGITKKNYKIPKLKITDREHDAL